MINDKDPTTDMTPQTDNDLTPQETNRKGSSVDPLTATPLINPDKNENTPTPKRTHEPTSSFRTPSEPRDTPLWPEDIEDKKEMSPEDDMEASELSKLRCGSAATEELAEKEKQKQARRNRQNRCPDYPGLAFGSAMFGSDTSMKFNIIKNELHNIMKSQLRRVEGEVNALSSRVKQLDKNLEESEFYIKTATSTLAEAVAIQVEEAKNSNHEDEDNNPLSAFDRQVAFLEGQLKGARVLARKSFLILEDCDLEQEQIIAAGMPSNMLDNKTSQTQLTCDTENLSQQNLNIQNIANNNNGDSYESKTDIGNANQDDLANANLPSITSE